MAQIINPNSFRLGTKLTWWSIAHYNIKNTSLSSVGYEVFHNDLLIRKYTEQILKNFNIIVSEIIISRKHRTITNSRNMYNPYFNKIKSNKTNKIKNIEERKRKQEDITLEFLVYFNKNIRHIEKKRKIRNITIVIKRILENILNTKEMKLYNIKFNIKEVPNPTYNVNILGSWIGQELTNNPRRHKAVIKKALYLVK